jgi:hypothetical protein
MDMLDRIRDKEYTLASQRGDRQGTFRSAYLDFDRGIRVGAFASRTEYDHTTWDLHACRRQAQRLHAHAWGGFQLFWPMSEQEVQATSGPDLVDAIMAVFAEVTPVMNLCMYAPCLQDPQTVLATGPHRGL